MRFDRLFMVAVTSVTAGALLYFSGRARSGLGPRGETVARTSEHRENTDGASGGSSVAGPGSGNVAAGERRYLQTCAACHGPGGMGQPYVGANLRDSRFIREQSDDALVAFVKKGRLPGDPRSVFGLTMPPMGGNPALEDGQIRDIVAFLRTVQAQARSQDAQAELN